MSTLPSAGAQSHTQSPASPATAPEPVNFARVPLTALADPELSDRAKVVLAGLVAHHYRPDQVVTVSHRRLAEATGKSRSAVRRGLDELVARGYLERIGADQPGPATFELRFAFKGNAFRGKERPSRCPDLTTPPSRSEQGACSDLSTPPLKRNARASGERREEKKTAGAGVVRTPPPAESPDPEPDAPPSPEDLAAWRQWARDRRHPFRRLALAKLAELGEAPPPEATPGSSVRESQGGEEASPPSPHAGRQARARERWNRWRNPVRPLFGGGLGGLPPAPEGPGDRPQGRPGPDRAAPARPADHGGPHAADPGPLDRHPA